MLIVSISRAGSEPCHWIQNSACQCEPDHCAPGGHWAGRIPNPGFVGVRRIELRGAAVKALVEEFKVHPACLFHTEVRAALAKTPTDETIRVLIESVGADRWTVRSNAEATLEGLF